MPDSTFANPELWYSRINYPLGEKEEIGGVLRSLAVIKGSTGNGRGLAPKTMGADRQRR